MNLFFQMSSIKQIKKEYTLKISVGIMFVIMVIGVSLIFHFYERKIYLLELGAQIKFDEITRHIDFKGEDEVNLNCLRICFFPNIFK